MRENAYRKRASKAQKAKQSPLNTKNMLFYVDKCQAMKWHVNAVVHCSSGSHGAIVAVMTINIVTNECAAAIVLCEFIN